MAVTITETVRRQNGVLFGSPALVHRTMYTGRGVIAPNTAFSPELMDDRDSLPVEWWIMSKTHAKNPIPKENEGITSLIIGDQLVPLPAALATAETELMGEYSLQWPLTKILDIGGSPRPMRLQADAQGPPEVPPIPCHVHAGDVVGDTCVGHGKTEAYFFPPLNVPPYNMQLSDVKTRLGLKQGVTREQVLKVLGEFGRQDDLYTLLNEFPVKPWESWTIEEKIIHAPGPWVTFEIQLPQDDFHLLAWVLGEEIESGKLDQSREMYHLRGLSSEEKLLTETVDWSGNTDPEFKSRWWHSCEVLRQGSWGRVVRLFYHCFYGEGFIVSPGHVIRRDKDERPFAGIVWSGGGTVNGSKVNCQDQLCREFLVTPQHELELENSSDCNDFIVFIVFPLIPT